MTTVAIPEWNMLGLLPPTDPAERRTGTSPDSQQAEPRSSRSRHHGTS